MARLNSDSARAMSLFFQAWNPMLVTAGPYLGMLSQIRIASSSRPQEASTAPSLKRASTSVGASSAIDLNAFEMLEHSLPEGPPAFLAAS